MRQRTRIQRYSNPDEAFNARTERQGDCVVWTAAKHAKGYGIMHVHGRKTYAHRYAWERIHGPIPDGLLVDHICHNTSCVNVAHLRLATLSQNMSNRGGVQPNALSKVRGVRKNRNRWQAYAFKDHKFHYFGSYVSIEEAAAAAEQGRQELFGEYAGLGGPESTERQSA